MNKIEYIRGEKTKYETMTGDELTISPKTNGQLIDLLEEFQEEWDEAQDVKMEEQDFLKIVKEKPAKFLDEMVDEEIDNEYFLNNMGPNDLYNIVKAFKEVNFTFLRSLIAKKDKLLGTLTQATQKK